MEKLDVKLDAFEGPLDLLLHLIEKNKVDIYDIPISEITAQYLDYISEIPQEDMERASAFMVMAATLIDIKSRMLLPPEKDEEGEDIDPRDELVRQLLEYKMYRYIADELRGRQEKASCVYYKEPDIPEEILKFRPVPKAEDVFSDVQVQDLCRVFQRLLKQQADRVDPVRSSFGKIRKESVALPEKMERLKGYAKRHKRFSFKRLVHASENKMDVIVTFIALLEMMKQGSVTVKQDALFDDIEIESKIAEAS